MTMPSLAQQGYSQASRIFSSFRIPKHPGFLGGPAAEGGWLSNVVKESFGDLLPEGTIRNLERNFRVPFDPSTSQRLETRVEGLGPRTHRMASLGHDPILGWYFGVRDILAGGFTTIGSDGRLVIQSMPDWEPAEFGVGLFVKILEAFQLVAGHLLSDVATPAGLPPPLFGLLQFFQQGGIGKHSIADVARAMYRSGYDFRHFLAGGISVAIVEVFVRTAWTVRELSEGKKLIDALPVGGVRLRSSLFLSHSVVTAINAGKVAVTPKSAFDQLCAVAGFFPLCASSDALAARWSGARTSRFRSGKAGRIMDATR